MDKKSKMYSHCIKRIIDIVLSLVAFVFFFPVFLIVSVVLYFANDGEIFFKQERPGKDNEIFTLIKFKSMTSATDVNGELLPDALRLTKTGAFIRKSSLDELPQLINVFMGDMSLIGPRPLLVKYLPLYDQTQIKRHNVRPGITGLAQIKGRNNISWKRKLSLDVWYAENVTFTLDVKIFFLTILKIFTSEGVSKEGHATTDTFTGSDSGTRKD